MSPKFEATKGATMFSNPSDMGISQCLVDPRFAGSAG